MRSWGSFEHHNIIKDALQDLKHINFVRYSILGIEFVTYTNWTGCNIYEMDDFVHNLMTLYTKKGDQFWLLSITSGWNHTKVRECNLTFSRHHCTCRLTPPPTHPHFLQSIISIFASFTRTSCLHSLFSVMISWLRSPAAWGLERLSHRVTERWRRLSSLPAACSLITKASVKRGEGEGGGLNREAMKRTHPRN